ncbi:UNVERIFIED_CONTAM: Pro-Pol polyprotein [Sesamum latifolium]|uniref:Pro-Pol polyprotein n=1 Tax=Sesamum latifolium TaxID=2727402 RepID=A0AAW2VXK6_9LAMI
MMGRTEVNDLSRKGIIRMITGGSAGGDSQRARKAQVREAYGIKTKEIMDVEPADDTPLIQFDQEEHIGPRMPGNDTLVITALLANYEIERVFIDSDSSADILFGDDQMQFGDAPLEAVDTSLYGFAGEVVHPRGMISLPLTLGTFFLRKTCLLKFLVVDIPSAYNVILGRPTFNAFRAIISMYHMKINFSVVGGVGEAQANIFQARKCYVEAIKRGKKRILEEVSGEENSNKRGKDSMPRTELKEEAPVIVQPVEELLIVELIPGDPDKITKIGFKMKEDVREQVISCLRKDKDIFAWTPQDLEGIDPGIITHHLNLDPTIRPIKQKKRYFGPEKDKIIQREVNKLLTAGHIREIQFPEWLSNVVLVPKPGGKWRMCIDFRDLNKACPRTTIRYLGSTN